MASTILPIQATVGIRASASVSHRKSDRKSPSPSWWTPIFGWSSEPDYIDGGNNSTEKTQIRIVSDSDTLRVGSRFTPGCFTEEKAKMLRKKAMETETFHDIMYHSAIASRLASDLPNRASSGR